jgi:hypothetical protein
MQSSTIMRKFALLTRQELAYVSGELPQLTNTQKSKLNYKIKKKLEILERIEIPLIVRAGFELLSISLSVENNKDCHSFDPGSKFGLEKNKKKKIPPNGHPSPGAFLLLLFLFC